VIPIILVMYMRHVITGAILIGMAAGGALAGTHSYDGTGTVEMFSGSFDGADSFPFLGLAEGSFYEFHFEFDANATAVSDNGTTAQYAFGGGGSFIQMGGSVVEIETLGVTVSTTGFLGFHVENAGLGFTANIDMDGGVLDSTELPDSFELSQWGGGGYMDADSSENQFLLNIVLGSVQTATITPAPGTACLMLSGLGIVSRRRR
jgi:uncharacterized protein (TIGR03382 family)